MFGSGEISRVVKLSRKLHAWWCLSVNSFKFQLCNQTPPGTETLWFPVIEELPIKRLHFVPEEGREARLRRLKGTL